MEVTRARYQHGRVQKQPNPKRRAGLAVVLACLVALFGYGTLAHNKPVQALGAETTVLQTVQSSIPEIAWPAKGQAALGDADSGVLARYAESEKQQPIASITKVITALVVLDKQPLAIREQGPVYTVAQADIDSYHAYVARLGSVMPVNSGQQLSAYQALQGLMLPSANNMADSLVRWTFGSMDAYLIAANQFLARHNLNQTIVDDASGFSPGSKSTPSDLIKIGQLALAHPVLSEIIQTREAVIPGTGTIRNSNFLLADDGAVGIKTGTTDEAGYCLLFAVKHGPEASRSLIGVVLGQSSWRELQAEVRSLRDQALDLYSYIEIMPAGTTVGRYKTGWGQVSEAVTLDSLLLYTWTGGNQAVDTYLEPIETPLQAGTVVGTAWAESDKNVQTKVVLSQPLSAPNLFWKLRNYW